MTNLEEDNLFRFRFKAVPATFVVLAAVGLLVVPASASALKYVSYEVVPNGSPAVPVSFVSEVSSPVLKSEQQSIYCGKGFASGSFTSAKKGTEVEWFTGCSIEGSSSYKVHTPGAATGELVTVTTPIEAVWDEGVNGPAIVVNPKTAPPIATEFIPTLEFGVTKAGPIAGSTLVDVKSSEPKTTKFSTHYRNGDYEDELRERFIWTSLTWTNFKGSIGPLSISTEKEAAVTFAKAIEFKRVEIKY